MDRGYIKLYRKTFDHWSWDDNPKTKFEAWIMLLKMANHENKKILFGSELININIGDIITSEVKLSSMLKWSRSKVRLYLELLKNDGMITQKKDSKKTHITICNYLEYNDHLKIKKTGKEQDKDIEKTLKKHNEELLITIKELKKELTAFKKPASNDTEFYTTKLGKRLSGKRLETFNLFWETFNFKKDKANAADSWLNIKDMTDSLVNEILKAAKIEADNRQSLIDNGSTPKWAQGWLTSRRWEDEIIPEQEKKVVYLGGQG